MPVPVLLLSRELGQGGSERQLVEIAKALNRSRFTVHVGCFDPGGFRSAELRREGIPILHLPITSFLSFGAIQAASQLRKYIRQHGIQLVHAFDTPMNCFGVPVAWLSRTPVVLSSQRASRHLSKRWEQFVLRITDRLVDATVVNCEAMQRHMTEDEHVEPEHLRICYNGVDTAHFQPRPKERPPALQRASLVIGVVCALRQEKGLPTLVEAFTKVATLSLSPPHCDLHLLIVGGGVMLAPLQEMSIRLGVQDRCHFEPSTADVASWLRAIDIFVLPSLSEALSNSLMEAMASGCAVVASRVGGNPELVSEGTTGLLFHAGDGPELAAGLQQLIENEDLRLRMGAAAAADLRARFPLEASAKRMEDIYEELLGIPEVRNVTA